MPPEEKGIHTRFFICDHCSNIVTFVKDKGVPIMCCGQKMRELIPNTADAATEKHVPVISVEGSTVTVTVSTSAHPMLDVHYIEWIALETEQGIQRKELHPGDEPKARFALCEGDRAVAAYAYCNLHELWKA